jgi:hypothetical protein
MNNPVLPHGLDRKLHSRSLSTPGKGRERNILLAKIRVTL